MWPPWIIIRKINNSTDAEEPDVMILDVKSENEYGNLYQIVKYITDAYNNKEMLYLNRKSIRTSESDYLSAFNFYIRGRIQGAAASIIHVSRGCITPGTLYYYEDYTKEMKSKKFNYEIEISDKPDDNDGYFSWNITLSKIPKIKENTNFDSITKTVNQWDLFISVFVAKSSFGSAGVQRYDYSFENVKQNIKDSIFFQEISFNLINELYDNFGPCPCDICLVKATCIQFTINSWNQKHRLIAKQCEKSENYNQNCLSYLNNIKIDDDLTELM